MHAEVESCLEAQAITGLSLKEWVPYRLWKRGFGYLLAVRQVCGKAMLVPFWMQPHALAACMFAFLTG